MNIGQKLTPDISGIFWFTEENINQRPGNFNDLDYIFDGLLSKNLSDKEGTLPSLFFTKSFSKKVFLYHFPKEVNVDFFPKSFEIISKNNLETRKFLVIDETKKDWISFLKKKHSNYTFLN